ncbi:AAA family ATPase [Pectobacterium sp. B2J-2]|uniref:AAA family ATPase n=1 Tax=Pectobacterium sp. B2J-2 TaxID=3385372 RepID=UPI0038FC9414
MFVSLKIENFRSIKDEIEFSFRASGGSNHLDDHVVDAGDHGGNVVRSIGLYGPNASGKSNILKAFAALQHIIVATGSLKNGDEIICYEPFLLSNKTKNSPTKFTSEFLVNNIRYIYFVSYNKNEIIQETLDFYPSKVKSNVFTRLPGNNWDDIKFGGNYKGGAKKIPFFKNNSYLSKAGDNASSPQMVRDVFDYFSSVLLCLRTNISLRMGALANIRDRNAFTALMGRFLYLFDTGVTKVSAKERDISFINLPSDLPEEIKQGIISENSFSFYFNHSSEEGDEIEFAKEDESEGTKKLFDLGPAIASAFISKRTVIIDELEHSLHPHLAVILLRLFNDSEVNIHGSQLIFSTHSVELMKPERMRRDQIWFSEKKMGVTSAFSLDDFDKEKVKPSTPFNKWYDDGRFGGVPQISYVDIKNHFMNISGNKNNNSDKDVFGTLDDIPSMD